MGDFFEELSAFLLADGKDNRISINSKLFRKKNTMPLIYLFVLAA
jgi:hypothetical protein